MQLESNGSSCIHGCDRHGDDGRDEGRVTWVQTGECDDCGVCYQLSQATQSGESAANAEEPLVIFGDHSELIATLDQVLGRQAPRGPPSC